MKSLGDALYELPITRKSEYKDIYLEPGFYAPGYLCVLAAFIDKHSIEERLFDAHPDTMGYLKTMGFHKNLWQTHQNMNRTTSGKNYSPLTSLESSSDINIATTTINQCIRHLLKDYPIHAQGLHDLYNVIGELHDNVWSHGLSTGYSMAQKTQVPHSKGLDYHIEFALADCGMGFLAELQRAKIPVTSHKDAIEWCLEEGNSSKHSNDIDDWRQRLPDDFVGQDPTNGFGGEIPVNNHQGLGLGHLIKLIKQYQGELFLCTGDSLYTIKENGSMKYETIKYDWHGVAISCKFKLSSLLSSIKTDELITERKNILISRLRGIQK